MNDIALKITKCVGDGQSECKRCADIKGFNRFWMSMLYKIDGFDGCYCYDCMRFIVKKLEKKQEEENND